MSCYCEFGETADIWNEMERKAYKEHKCSECKEIIEKGEQYVHISVLFDGSWSNYHMCEYCRHDWDLLEKAGHCIAVGELKESWKEHWTVPEPIADHSLYSYPGGNLWERK